MTDKVDELRKKIEVILGVSHVDEPPTEEVADLLALITQQQHLLLDRVLEEVVGEDEPVDTFSSNGDKSIKPHFRNKLRKEQRQAIQTIKENL